MEKLFKMIHDISDIRYRKWLWDFCSKFHNGLYLKD